MFAFVTASVLCAKLVHIRAHQTALSGRQLRKWGYSFFAQDMILLFAVRVLLDGWLFSSKGRRCIRSFIGLFASIFIFYVSALCVVSTSFYAVAGSEIHWRNLAFAGDAAGRALLLSGIVYFLLVLVGMMAIAWLTQSIVFVVSGLAMDVLELPKTLLCMFRDRSKSAEHKHGKYSEIPLDDSDTGFVRRDTDSRKYAFLSLFGLESVPWGWIVCWLGYALVISATFAQVILFYIRPLETALTFMSWTPALLPFVDFKNSSPNLERLIPVYRSGIDWKWDRLTALVEPKPLQWLPKNKIPMGFEDWYGAGKKHYSAKADPLKISNLEDKILPKLGNLGDVPIRHVMVVMLESTRKDVFPIKKDGLIWKRFESSFDDKKLPEEAIKRLETLTSTANYLTGDYNDGFNHGEEKKRRGGINFNDAYTAGTYTLKSIVGSLCGISPLVADFNIEYSHHIYQPCLPQIFEALNSIDDKNKTGFNSYKWKSTFLQSVTLNYDKFDRLIPALGFPKDRIIDKDYLKKPTAKFGVVNLPDVNYFGMAEICLEDYIRDAFSSAKKNNERVFMTHITSTSHHPYKMPAEEHYVPLTKTKALEDLSKYTNSIGYDDRWLGKVLQILEQEGVANETLVVFVGDHGLSIPENNILASYYNPNVGCNHVPLVFSHPLLPAIDVNDPVLSTSILPTILDLLLETGSLGESAGEAARELMTNYEGQSLMRPLRKNAPNIDNKLVAADGKPSSHADWHFTLINPGRAMVGVRDTKNKNWRLVVPVIQNIEWRFTDLGRDPTEKHPLQGFQFSGFVKKIEEKHSIEAAKWAEEAAFMARWWVEENSKRWRYAL